MGCKASKTEAEKLQDKKNKEVEKEMRERRKEILQEVKLLLLGTGESGKSTIAKQMKILHQGGFSKPELLSYRPVVFNNAITSMKNLISAAQRFGFALTEENQTLAQSIDAINTVELDQFTNTMAKQIQTLWEDPAIKQAYDRRNEYQLFDGAEYCFLHADRFAQPDYVPTHEDVLRVRARTTGIIETTFRIKETNFRMMDVGGQRSERKKWIHCFEDVTAIIYCVALNEYNMKLFEDERVNRMTESLELFEEICNSKWFTKTAIILFLNKTDLFRDKIKTVDLSVLFPEYTGGCDYENGLKFITDKFLSLNRSTNKKMYVHSTCATDTEHVRIVFDAAKEIIISQNLERLGFGHL